MKRYVLIFVAFVMLLSFCGCSLSYRYINNAEGSFCAGYSERLEDAFWGEYIWDGTEEKMNIIIPDEYNGVVVKTLGGYCGRGVPTPFTVDFADSAKESLSPNADRWYNTSVINSTENSNVTHLKFDLHISKNIKEIENLYLDKFIFAEYAQNGQTYCKVYVLTFNITCDDDNKYFYANDGKLYYKKDDSLVKEIFYEDFDFLRHVEENKNATGWKNYEGKVE